jgi:stress response protein YsnF
MSELVICRFDHEAEAEQALSLVASKLSLLDSAVLSNSVAGTFALESLDLTPEERATCQEQLKAGGFLMAAQVATRPEAEAVLEILDASRRSEPARAEQKAPAPAAPAPAPPVATPAARTAPAAAAPAPAPASPPATAPASPAATGEERIPIVEGELRIGKREVVRGGARVHAFITDVPVQEQVELAEERTSVEHRPANRRLTDEEVIEGGLLQERVVEVARMREVPVVSKEAFVREEVVVRKTVEHRIEEINETVRRTEVETERFGPQGRSAFGGFRTGTVDDQQG